MYLVIQTHCTTSHSIIPCTHTHCTHTYAHTHAHTHTHTHKHIYRVCWTRPHIKGMFFIYNRWYWGKVRLHGPRLVVIINREKETFYLMLLIYIHTATVSSVDVIAIKKWEFCRLSYVVFVVRIYCICDAMWGRNTIFLKRNVFKCAF